jgi:hypothetical protein
MPVVAQKSLFYESLCTVYTDRFFGEHGARNLTERATGISGEAYSDRHRGEAQKWNSPDYGTHQ